MNLEAGTWEKLPPLPEPNGGFVCGVSNGKIVIAGGTHWQGGQKNWLNKVHLFDPQKKIWASPFTLDHPVAYAVGGSLNRGLVFVGGSTGSQGFPSLVIVEDQGQVVIRKGLPQEQAIVLAAGGVMDGRILFTGGTNDAANLAGMGRRTLAVDSQGNIEQLPDYPGKPVITAASATAGGELFVFAGANADDSKAVINTDEAHAFHLQSRQWRPLCRYPYPVRGLTAVALNERQIYLAGGYKNDAEGFTDNAFIYDIASDTYQPARSLPYRGMVGLVIHDGFLYCLGGEDKQRSRTDACYRIALSELTSP